jgi:hypothetical protein
MIKIVVIIFQERKMIKAGDKQDSIDELKIEKNNRIKKYK